MFARIYDNLPSEFKSNKNAIYSPQSEIETDNFFLLLFSPLVLLLFFLYLLSCQAQNHPTRFVFQGAKAKLGIFSYIGKNTIIK